MTAPLCPHCRERMSSVEQGLGGVWSCLYCEGTWLTAQQMQALAPTTDAAPSHALQASPVSQDEGPGESLVCPGCDGSRLQAVSLGAVRAHRCPLCHGAFFNKGVVAALAPQLLSRSQEAPIASTLLGTIGTVLLLGDPLPLNAALELRRQEHKRC